MTNEEKQAFFACYINQFVGYDTERAGMYHKLSPEHFCITDYIELRALDQLTDDEAIEVAKIVTPVIFTRSGKIFVTRDSEEIQVRNKMNIKFTVIEFTECAVYAYSEDEGYDHNPNMVNAIDYLRSIGVLVGFRHFTPEMLIAEGVVKLKSTKQ